MAKETGNDTKPDRPSPDFADVKYGPHERNVLDLYLAKSAEPTPLVVHIHGGGFRGGDKSGARPSLIGLCLKAGISIAPINYRLSQHAAFPSRMLDGALAVQFLRANAEKWNLDANRLAATGGSAGGGISLWLGFHDDMADPTSDDEVARQSTRLTCMALINTQSSYDLRFIRDVIGWKGEPHPALLDFYGITADQVDAPHACKMFQQASAINYLSAGDPPVFMFYSQPNKPLTAESTANEAVHHPKFGQVLKEKMDALGIECILRCGSDYEGQTKDERIFKADPDIVAFFQQQFST